MPPIKARFGIDIREASQSSGKGKVTLELTKALLRLLPDEEVILFSHCSTSLFQEFPNASVWVISGKGLRWHWNLAKLLKTACVEWFIAPTSMIVPALAPKNQKVALLIHDLITFLHPKGHPLFPTLVERLTLPRAVQKASLLACVSTSTLKDLHRCLPSSKFKPSILVPPAVSEEFHRVNSRKMDLPERFFLTVGAHLPRKNHGRIFKAFAQLRSHPDLHLCVAGAFNAWTPALKRQIPAEIKARVHFLGPVSQVELVELYSRAEALIFPSLYEGFGMPPLEAMACGCPVLTSAGSSLPEVVGDAAVQVNPFSVQDLHEGMEHLLDPKVAAMYRIKGQKQVKNFAWDKSARVLLNGMEVLGR